MSEVLRAKLATAAVNAFVVRWANLAAGDTGEMLEAVQYTDKSVQVGGTFGVGGAVVIEGSNDGNNWATLTDPQGNALNMSSASIELVSEATRYIRPRVIGDGTTDLTLHLLLKE
jgi:hypothetical protein